MVIADRILTLFREFLRDPAGILSQDALNTDFTDMGDRDLDEAELAYLSPGALPDPASGCIIGVIDDAVPFVHQRFTLPGNLSRVASVWIQDARFRGAVGLDLPTGAEWRGAELSGLLADLAAGRIPDEDAIYRQTGAVDLSRPAPPSGAFAAGHGAAVAPLAAGFAPSDPQAQNHPLIAVCLPPRITADSMGTLALVPIMTGIAFIILRARRLCRFIEKRKELSAGSVRLPVVINLSLGLTAGARDGQSLLERFMDAVCGFESHDLGPVHIVLPAGNHRQARLRVRLQPGEEIAWRLPPDDPTLNAIEIWGPPHDDRQPTDFLQTAITVPGLTPVTTAFTDALQHSTLFGPDGRELAWAYSQAHGLPGGRRREGIVIITAPTCPERQGEPFVPPGEWRVQVSPGSPAGDYQFSAQRDEVIRGFRGNARQSWFHDPAYRSHDERGFPIRTDAQNGGDPLVIRSDTINTYATGQRTLRAGSACRQDRGATLHSSLLADGEAGDCMAPVDTSRNTASMIVRGRDSGGFALSSGTSMAAPQLARWLAGQLSAGQRPQGRQAIRDMIQTQYGGPDNPPVLAPAPSFREF